MLFSRIFSRISKTGLNHCRGLDTSRQEVRAIFSNNCVSLRESATSVHLQHHSFLRATVSQHFWHSSSASPQHNDKETNQSGEGDETATNNNHSNGDSESVGKVEDTGAGGDLSFDDLVKLVAEKEELLVIKHKALEKMQDKVLRTYAEMENVMDRTRREAENSKKFAIQNFAKSLLDVADNLGRASSVVKDSFAKIDSSKDTSGAVPLLKTLLEGVEMTEKQLAEVFRKFGMEKFDPMNEQFDPNRHHAVFQIPDGSKPPGIVAAVLKSGYMLHDRIIRPAEVGVTVALNSETNQS